MAKQWDQEIRAKVIARAWKDDAFRKKLMSNPHEALKEYGVTLDKNVQFKVCNEDPNHLFFILPASPTHVNKLSVAELEKIAAAGYTDNVLCTKDAGCPWYSIFQCNGD